MKKIDPNLKKIVLAKIDNYDDDWELSIGSHGTFGKLSLLDEVKNETVVGKKVVSIQREFMEDLVNGKLYRMINEV